ncbi:hypothetical protein [Enterococcus sp. BWR-S5]|uniref:hypothetical protein n=1 Tax=Enterococcus sp. BWR-S5 TaxID=2787714 RepID=UPI001920DD2A|nr:hypothetical protein [Enterococcus sp. BWR-S5]MBL1226253.1 hypothetical protein [Enterococcus sp. BWR-S5]
MKKWFGVVLLLLVFIYGETGEAAITNSGTNGQNIRATIVNQEDLDTYLNATGTDLSGDIVTFRNTSTLTFPNKWYFVKDKTTEWWFESISNGADVDLNEAVFAISNQSNFYLKINGGGTEENMKSIRNGTFLGSSNTNNKGGFIGQMLNGQHWYFKNLVFKNAHLQGHHLFDLAGCTNINFDTIKAYGYGHSEYSTTQLRNLYEQNPHNLYAEAIQLDLSIDSAFGGSLKDKSFFKNIQPTQDSTTKVILKDSLFTTYDGRSAQGYIDGTKETVVRNYSATAIGSHTGDENKPYTELNFYRNTFNKTIRTPDKTDDKRMYPIHVKYGTKEQVKQTSNVFQNQYGNPSSNGHVGGYLAWYQ